MYEKEIIKLGNLKLTVYDLAMKDRSLTSSVLFLIDPNYENNNEYLNQFYNTLIKELKKKSNITQEAILKRFSKINNIQISDNIHDSYRIYDKYKIKLIPEILEANFKYNSLLYDFNYTYDGLLLYTNYIDKNIIINEDISKVKINNDTELYQKIINDIQSRDMIKDRIFFYNLLGEKDSIIDYDGYYDFYTYIFDINIIFYNDGKTEVYDKGNDKYIVLMKVKDRSYFAIKIEGKNILDKNKDKRILSQILQKSEPIVEIKKKQKFSKGIQEIIEGLKLDDD